MQLATHTQRPLALPGTKSPAKLWGFAVISARLPWDEDMILDRIETGDLEWAWDLSSGDLRAARHVREILVWAGCVEAVAQAMEAGSPRTIGRQANGWDEDVVKADVVTGNRMDLRIGEVAQRLGVRKDTVFRWVRQGWLPTQQRGGARWIGTAALWEFLRSRRIGATSVAANRGNGHRGAMSLPQEARSHS